MKKLDAGPLVPQLEGLPELNTCCSHVIRASASSGFIIERKGLPMTSSAGLAISLQRCCVAHKD